MLWLLIPFLLWSGSCPDEEGVRERFSPPVGYERPITTGFANWLSHTPLLPARSPVLLHTGIIGSRQDVHAAVLDISVGKRDLQQCADAVIRLRAEYLFTNGAEDQIEFHFTNGFLADWKRWRKGERIRVVGNTCSWIMADDEDGSHEQLLRFLDTVFMYAGTLSLSKELKPCYDLPIAPGDVFIHGGSPGHAMIVLDVAVAADGSRVFLLGQSYMPARSIHIVKNWTRPELGAWFILQPNELLRTPEWTFQSKERMRWR